MADDEKEVAVQVNGKTKLVVTVPVDISKGRRHCGRQESAGSSRQAERHCGKGNLCSGQDY